MWPNGHTVYFLRGLCPIGYAVGIGVDVMREEEIIVVRRNEYGVVYGLFGLEDFDPAKVRDVAEWIDYARREAESESD